MELEIVEEGKGPIEIFNDLPGDLKHSVLEAATPIGLRSNNIHALFQQFAGQGFSVWFSRYFAKDKVVLKARSNVPVLELRVALMNQIEGEWDKILQPSLKQGYFNLSFTPHVQTRAIFNKGGEYKTFDIHFELPFLLSLGYDYKSLDIFLNSVSRNEPTELAAQPFPCSGPMIDAVQLILNNEFSLEGKMQMLTNKVKEILLLALEVITKSEGALPIVLKPGDIEKLRVAKDCIGEKIPVFPGNKMLCQETGLNEFKLNVGFRHLYGMSPYDYYMRLKFQFAKEQLKEPANNIEGVAFTLGYEQASSFIKEFKKIYGYTPGWWKKSGPL